MIPIVENLYFYSRKNNILYGVTPEAIEIPLIKFKQNFRDILMLESQELKYMKDYMQMWPNLWEPLYPAKKEQQLTFF